MRQRRRRRDVHHLYGRDIAAGYLHVDGGGLGAAALGGVECPGPGVVEDRAVGSAVGDSALHVVVDQVAHGMPVGHLDALFFEAGGPTIVIEALRLVVDRQQGEHRIAVKVVLLGVIDLGGAADLPQAGVVNRQAVHHGIVVGVNAVVLRVCHAVGQYAFATMSSDEFKKAGTIREFSLS